MCISYICINITYSHVHVYIYIIYMYINIILHIHIYIHIYIFNINKCTYIHLNIYVLCTYINICMYVYIYIYIYVYYMHSYPWKTIQILELQSLGHKTKEWWILTIVSVFVRVILFSGVYIPWHTANLPAFVGFNFIHLHYDVIYYAHIQTYIHT
jgi:hypothetical protein